MEEVYWFSDNIEPVSDITRYHINDLSFITDKKIVITTCNNKQVIKRFYNEFNKNMEIESVKNYDYSVKNLLAHDTPIS
jgi:choline kinase